MAHFVCACAVQCASYYKQDYFLFAFLIEFRSSEYYLKWDNTLWLPPYHFFMRMRIHFELAIVKYAFLFIWCYFCSGKERKISNVFLFWIAYSIWNCTNDEPSNKYTINMKMLCIFLAWKKCIIGIAYKEGQITSEVKQYIAFRELCMYIFMEFMVVFFWCANCK